MTDFDYELVEAIGNHGQFLYRE